MLTPVRLTQRNSASMMSEALSDTGNTRFPRSVLSATPFSSKNAFTSAGENDLQDSWHKSVDGFEGAKLNVTVTFTDGSEQMQSMTLHTGKLAVEYKGEASGASLTGEVLTDEQAAAEGYIYGVYAELD